MAILSKGRQFVTFTPQTSPNWSHFRNAEGDEIPVIPRIGAGASPNDGLSIERLVS